METKVNICIEKLQSVYPDNDQYCNNLYNIYPDTMIFNGFNLYTNVSKSQFLGLFKKSMGGNRKTSPLPGKQ